HPRDGARCARYHGLSLHVAMNAKLVGWTLASVVSIATPGIAVPASGMLDPTFGSGGIVTTPIGGLNPQGRGLALQADGRIVVSGGSGDGPGIVARYLSNGVLDSSFGSGGVILGPSGSNYFQVSIQPDGRIIVAGFVNATPSVAAVTRFQSDGRF